MAAAYQWGKRKAWLSGRGGQEPGLSQPESHGKGMFSFGFKYLNAIEAFKEYN